MTHKLLQEQSGLTAERRVRAFPSREPELARPSLDLAEPEQQQAEVEADGRGMRELLGQRPEPGERPLRMVLVEAADGCGNLGLGVVRRERGRLCEDPLRRERPSEPLERDPVQKLRPNTPPARERRELTLGSKAREGGGRVEARHERREPAVVAGVEEVVGADRGERVRRGALRLPPGGERSLLPAGPEQRDPEVERDERAVGVARSEPAQPLERPVGPRRHRRPRLGVERVVAGEDRSGCARVPVRVERRSPPQGDSLGVPAHAEVELERRPAAETRRRGGPSVPSRAEHNRGCHCTRSGDGDAADGGVDARTRSHAATIAAGHLSAATLSRAMASYRELLQRVKLEIGEVGAARARELLDGDDRFAIIDVRERDEWDEGHLPGAIHIPRGSLESRIEQAVPDRDRPVLVYCAQGNRSAFAARTLEELGYETVSSLAGGFMDWKRNGHPTELSRSLSPQGRIRYSRHLLIPEVGEEGQLRLLDSRVLLIGAGGLGSPAALYLAAAGIGTLGIVDDDVVDESNLQRQVLHSTASLGEPKTESAARAIRELNPDVQVMSYSERLTPDNVDRILGDGWHVIVDGADNFPTRYLLNDASIWHGIPVVHGSIFRFEGQLTVFKPGEGPCYRCLFPQPPPPELAPSCAEGGVLGVLPGIVGSLQAAEALKLALGIGDPLVGRLLLFDALEVSFTEVELRRDPSCPVCGESPTITEYVDYVEFCAGPRGAVT